MPVPHHTHEPSFDLSKDNAPPLGDSIRPPTPHYATLASWTDVRDDTARSRANIGCARVPGHFTICCAIVWGAPWKWAFGGVWYKQDTLCILTTSAHLLCGSAMGS